MFSFILNLPYAVIGILVGIVSFPKKLSFNKKPFAFLIYVTNFWWAISYIKNARAMTIGNVILLGPFLEDRDLEHELVHVEQYNRFPIIHPVLYFIELIKNGYRNNKYEVEAYNKAGNIYKEGEI